MLILSREQVMSFLSVETCIQELERVFKMFAKGEALVSTTRIFRQFGEGNAWMYAIAGAVSPLNRSIVKALPINWDNPRERKLPHMYGIILLCEQTSGVPLSIMDATYITNLRTGVLAALGAKYLAKKNPESLGVIGTGEIAKSATLALSAQFPNLKSIRVHSRSSTNRERFVDNVSRLVGAPINASGSPEDATRGADIVVTATSARGPVLKASMVEEGMYVHSMGSRQEVEPSVLQRAKVVAEGKEECKTHGKWGEALKAGAVKEDALYAELVEIIGGTKKGRTTDSETFFLDSVGLPIEDTILASRVYDDALRSGVGTNLELYDGLTE
ncbi:MAG TPA: ornithine cyclodeaminase family protein [Nitrososphaerales archaeon]|nr:ornithine cyclodeaminase family protein [Nitrososphaerales archaeon]